MNYSTLGEAIAARRTSGRAIHFIEGDNNERMLPFAQLYARAAGLLHHFQICGAGPDSEMILLLDSNEQFIDAFWAGVLGNIILVPLAPGATDEHRHKFFRVLRKLKRPHLCTDRKIFARLSAFAAEHGLTTELERIKPATVFLDQIDDISRPGRIHAARPDDIAFVQYSSGSTSEPKGVILTHRNLTTNIEAIVRGIDLQPSDSGLSWMPLTHDMGLIGFCIIMFANRIQINLMPTELFVRRPLLWTTFLSRKKATLTASPNFGYRHYLKVLGDRQIDGVDLSAVRVIFNGAEPISVELCDEFMNRMAPAGLSRSAMYPVYGLAEAAVAMTFPVLGSPYRSVCVERHHLRIGERINVRPAVDADSLTLMQVGRAIPYAELRLVDDADQPVAEDCVGHIQIRGDNVTAGYYRAPEANAALFSADGWLRTGDLGFSHGDELVIAGRAKEIIFVNGQNYFPHDIEAIAQRASGLELGKVAAAGCRPPGADTERLVLFVLHRGSLADFLPVAREVTRLVNEHAGLEVANVVPIRRMPKTTSGKVQRVALEKSWLAGEFDTETAELEHLRVAAQVPGERSTSEIENRIQAIIDELLPDKRVEPDDNLFEVGASSLTLVQIHERIDREFPGRLDLSELFDHPTVRDLAGHLASKLAGGSV